MLTSRSPPARQTVTQVPQPTNSTLLWGATRFFNSVMDLGEATIMALLHFLFAGKT